MKLDNCNKFRDICSCYWCKPIAIRVRVFLSPSEQINNCHTPDKRDTFGVLPFCLTYSGDSIGRCQ